MSMDVIRTKGSLFVGSGYDLIRRNRNYQMLAGAFAVFGVMHLLSTPGAPSGGNPAGYGPAQANVAPTQQAPSVMTGGNPPTVMPGQPPMMPYQQQGIGTVSSGVGMVPGAPPSGPVIPSYTVQTGPVQSSSQAIELKPSEEIDLSDIQISEAKDTGRERKPSERYRDYRTPTAPARN